MGEGVRAISIQFYAKLSWRDPNPEIYMFVMCCFGFGVRERVSVGSLAKCHAKVTYRELWSSHERPIQASLHLYFQTKQIKAYC